MSQKLLGTVTLPHHPRPGMEVLPQLVAINRCLQQLRDMVTPPQRNLPRKDTVYIHPFQLFPAYESSAYILRVAIGRVTAQRWVYDGANPPKYSAEDVQVFYDTSAGDLVNDDFGPTASLGDIDLSPSTTYGVWLVAAISEVARLDPTGNGYFTNIADFYCSGASIVVNSTYPDFDDAAAYSVTLTGSKALYYLGQVTTVTDGDFSFKQWRKSDISIGDSIMPADIT
jgi:hypothetical protein